MTYLVALGRLIVFLVLGNLMWFGAAIVLTLPFYLVILLIKGVV